MSENGVSPMYCDPSASVDIPQIHPTLRPEVLEPMGQGRGISNRTSKGNDRHHSVMTKVVRRRKTSLSWIHVDY